MGVAGWTKVRGKNHRFPGFADGRQSKVGRSLPFHASVRNIGASQSGSSVAVAEYYSKYSGSHLARSYY